MLIHVDVHLLYLLVLEFKVEPVAKEDNTNFYIFHIDKFK